MAIPEAVVKQKAEPTWEIAHLFPYQGDWSEEDYLSLDTNQLIEFSEGRLEFLPTPTPAHQRIVFFLQRILWAFVTERNLGEVLAAPLRVRLWPKKYREPDIVFLLTEHLAQQGSQYWENVDLVMEVVSPDKPSRDYEKKKKEYARAEIAEYWIVDPAHQLITILVLAGKQYTVFGEFKPGMQAASKLLEGFSVDVNEVFAAAQ